MRFYLISDNVDTAMGMRLAGIEGVVVHEDSEVRDALTKAMDCPSQTRTSNVPNLRKAMKRSLFPKEIIITAWEAS